MISATGIRKRFTIDTAQDLVAAGNKLVLAAHAVLEACKEMGVSQKERDEFVEWAWAQIERANNAKAKMLDADGVDPDFVPSIEASELEERMEAICSLHTAEGEVWKETADGTVTVEA